MATIDSPTVCTAPYGTWRSPITANAIVADTVGLDQVVIDGTDLYWIESRASEHGRCVLVRHRNGLNEDMLPAPWNVRTRVHEYGGGAYAVLEGVVYFSNLSDQVIYRADLSSSQAEKFTTPVAVTHCTNTRCRFTDAVIDRQRNRLIVVCEDHAATSTEPVNNIVAVDIDGHCANTVLVEGHDFFSSPKLSPDGNHLVGCPGIIRTCHGMERRFGWLTLTLMVCPAKRV